MFQAEKKLKAPRPRVLMSSRNSKEVSGGWNTVDTGAAVGKTGTSGGIRSRVDLHCHCGSFGFHSEPDGKPRGLGTKT